MNIFTGTSAPTLYRDTGKLPSVKLKQIGRLIFSARTAKGLSRRELSEATNVAQSTIQGVEDGTGNTAFEIVARLAEALDVRIAAYTSDLPSHSSPVDSADTVQPPAITGLQAGPDGSIPSGQMTKSPTGDRDGADSGTTAQLVAALDARLGRFEQSFANIADQLRRSLDALDENVWIVHALAEDFSEQAANLRTETDPVQHATSGAIGAGVPKVPSEHLKQVGGKGHRKKRTRPPTDDDGSAGD